MKTLEEASKLLRVSTRTLYRWIDNGKIKAQKVGQKFLISDEEIQFVKTNGLRGDKTIKD